MRTRSIDEALQTLQENVEDQIRLEEIGGEILVLDEEAFKKAVIRATP